MKLFFSLFPRLKERCKQAAGTLSGGEQPMLAVGHALVVKPDLLMLDEPDLGWAPLTTKEILHVIGDLRSTSVATLWIEQHARAALQTFNYGYVIETGDWMLAGPVALLAANPNVIDTLPRRLRRSVSSRPTSRLVSARR